MAKVIGEWTKEEKRRGFKASLDGNTLHLQIKLDGEGQASGSGKSIVLASTRGNRALVEFVDDAPAALREIKLGVNVYKAAE